MNSVLRRLDDPTRYGGLPIKWWALIISGVVGVAMLITFLKTPLLPTLAVLSWTVISPAVFLGMWAHQQGVSIPILIGDFIRFTLRRRGHVLEHVPAPLLRGGIALDGTVPDLTPAAPTWPDLDLDRQ